MKEIEIDEEKEIEVLRTYIINQVRNSKLSDLLECFEILTGIENRPKRNFKKHLTKEK